MQYLELPLASWDQCLRVYGSSGALDSQKSIEGKLPFKNLIVLEQLQEISS